ncbi:MAG TPA: YfiR family protein [Candidatus Binatia bacterium]|nr:YfiR family protein [Candidatus Binatia bacterium]
MRGSRLTGLRLFGALLLAGAGVAHAAAEAEALMKIKTAYLYNFMKFSHWPRSGGELQLCVAGDAAFATYAGGALQGKNVGGQAVRVTAIQPADDASGCWMIYTASGKPPMAAAATLTVGEGAAFLDAGGMLAFRLVDDRVRFAVDLRALRQAGLSADAQLLGVALEVRQ